MDTDVVVTLALGAAAGAAGLIGLARSRLARSILVQALKHPSSRITLANDSGKVIRVEHGPRTAGPSAAI